MRLLTLIFTWTILVSCSSNGHRETKSEFEKYLGTIGTLQTPVTFDSKTGIHTGSKQKFDSVLFLKYRHRWALKPIGKILHGDSVVLILDLVIGDVVVPILTTFDKKGIKLDSLNPYSRAGVDMGYECYEFGTITNDRDIMIVDSTRRWDLNKEETNIVNGTDKLTVDTIIYRIDNKGKFLKVKE
jgi:hypothetical protein